MAGKTAEKDPHVRHQHIWTFARPLARAVAWLKFGYAAEPADVPGTFLLVSNHNTNWDPVLVGCSFPQQMYFVASEHVLRAGLAGKLLNWLQAPIPRQKGGSAAATVMSMVRHLRRGMNVCVFPEGNRSWDGVTRPFPAAIGKVARSAGVSLVTYRLTGGYFASPRWSGNSSRRGRMRGGVVRVYSPEELRAMTPAEIDEHIREDIFEDAYARQRKDPVRFRGRRTAEHLETLLFLCPACGRVHTLQSKGDTVRCWKCGFSFRYLPTGFLAGEGVPFEDLRSWVRWQDGELRRMCTESGSLPIFTDSSVRVEEVATARSSVLIGVGDMTLYRDRLALPGVTIPLEKLTGMSVMGAQSLYLSMGERSFEVTSRVVRCMVKYLTACAFLTGNESLGV